MNKKKLWRLIGLLLPLSLIFLSVGSGSAFAQAAAPLDVIQETVTTSDGATRAYWTTDQLNSAISADAALQGEKAPTPPASSPTEPAGSMPPTPPTGSDAITQDPSTKSSAQPQASTVEYPYAFPFSTVGKVFFTDPVTKQNFSCSGTVVTSENRSTVDTAGHCLAAGGQKKFYTNWAFCAQYKNSCPTGHLWTARNLVTHSKWFVEGSIAYDYGVAVLSPNSNGKVVDYIGGAGWAYNQPYDQLYYALGFPAGRPFDGKELKLCTSLISQYDVPTTAGPTAFGVLCDMTGGSSGGGWLIALKGTFGYTNGHNDYKYVADSTRMYSPYYGKDWFLVFNAGQKL